MKAFSCLQLIPSKMNPVDIENYYLCCYLQVIYGFLDLSFCIPQNLTGQIQKLEITLPSPSDIVVI